MHFRTPCVVVKFNLFFAFMLASLQGFSQNLPLTPSGMQRIAFKTITSSINTGQDYSPWLNDDLNSLVQNTWQDNFVWVDVTLKLSQHSTISEFQFYDYQGIFNDQPDSIYALNGTVKTFLGTFTGPNYMIFDPLVLNTPVQADAIIIHKYANNIPQKILIYGSTGVPPDAGLSGLALSTGTLHPSFRSNLYTYSASVNNSVTSIQVTPTANDKEAILAVNNILLSAGSPSGNLDLSNGLNPVTVKVTASDHITSKVYTINVERDALAPPLPPLNPGGSPDTTIVQIPIDSTRWYVLNNTTHGLGALTDGNLTGQVNPGYGLLINNYDAYYPVKQGERIDLYQLKFYSYEGGTGNYPLTVSVIDSTGARTIIGTFSGGVYQSWLGPYPGNATYSLKKPMTNIKYLVLNCWYQFPTEMQLYGHYHAPPAVPARVKKGYTLNQYFGINGFEWNFEDPANPGVVSVPLLNAAKSFTQFRHYMDWNKLESAQGQYTFNPVHSGGWNYDALYQACKASNITVLADLKTLPNWLLNTYPSDQQDIENVPVPYGSDFTDPKSYILQAKAAFQFAARYGSNSGVSPSLLSVDPDVRWTNDPQNTVKEGTALVTYIECDNERDKWWKGRKAYQTSYEYAANLSAFYDGNMNTMGPGTGVKNADPNMMVVMGGLASADPSYVHGMIEWCRQHRGYKSDGTVNLCWDIINYHLYPNYASSGVAPERSAAAATAQNFLTVSHVYAGDMPVWVTESGYDANQGSPQKAPAIGGKSQALVEADWALRTSLLYARQGIQRVFFYEEYDDNAASTTQYASSGLMNNDQTRRPAADYLYQINKLFGAYIYKSSVSDSPVVDEYQSASNQQAFILYLPTQNGNTSNYTLNLETADSASIYRPLAGANDMSVEKVKLQGGKLSLPITETPLFVVPSGNLSLTTNLAAKVDSSDKNAAFDKTIIMYPNPSTSNLTILVRNVTQGSITIKVVDAMGNTYASYQSFKNNDVFRQSIDVSKLPRGVFIVSVKQGNQQTVRKVYKNLND